MWLQTFFKKTIQTQGCWQTSHMIFFRQNDYQLPNVGVVNIGWWMSGVVNAVQLFSIKLHNNWYKYRKAIYNNWLPVLLAGHGKLLCQPNHLLLDELKVPMRIMMTLTNMMMMIIIIIIIIMTMMTKKSYTRNKDFTLRFQLSFLRHHQLD